MTIAALYSTVCARNFSSSVLHFDVWRTAQIMTKRKENERKKENHDSGLTIGGAILLRVITKLRKKQRKKRKREQKKDIYINDEKISTLLLRSLHTLAHTLARRFIKHCIRSIFRELRK